MTNNVSRRGLFAGLLATLLCWLRPAGKARAQGKPAGPKRQTALPPVRWAVQDRGDTRYSNGFDELGKCVYTIVAHHSTVGARELALDPPSAVVRHRETPLLSS